MKRVAVFGGSFDPPHRGHAQVITQVLAQDLVDEVWLLPVGNHAFAKNLSPAADRVAMLELLLASLADLRVRVEDLELHQSKTSYTYRSLQQLHQAYPEHAFHWLMGSDLLADFGKWQHAAELVQEYSVLVYPRAGAGWEGLWPGMRPLQNFPIIEVSSTAARQALRAGAEVSDLVLPEVAAYSMAQHLYV